MFISRKRTTRTVLVCSALALSAFLLVLAVGQWPLPTVKAAVLQLMGKVSDQTGHGLWHSSDRQATAAGGQNGLAAALNPDGTLRAERHAAVAPLAGISSASAQATGQAGKRWNADQVPPGLTAQDWRHIQQAMATTGQQAYLKASNAGTQYLLGRSIAISGDTVVAGADGEDSNTTGVNGDQGNNLANSSGAA